MSRDTIQMDLGPWKPFLFYFLLILTPLIAYHCYRIHKFYEWKDFAMKQHLKETILQYHVQFSGVLTIYHLLLTLVLALYFIQIILTDLKIAVDLTYYTKTSIQTYQVCTFCFFFLYNFRHMMLFNQQNTIIHIIQLRIFSQLSHRED